MAITRTQIAKQLLAQGGRIGFQGGGADMGRERGPETGRAPGPVGGDGQGRDPSAQFGRTPEERKAIANTPGLIEEIKKREEKIGLGDKAGIPSIFPTIKAGLNLIRVKRGNEFADQLNKSIAELNEEEEEGQGQDPSIVLPPMIPQAPSIMEPEPEPELTELQKLIANTPRYRFAAEGGIMNDDVVGGEFDFESARQMYGLGKLVKKVTRTVKKIAKSPIGKVALLAAPFAFSPGLRAGLFGSPALAGSGRDFFMGMGGKSAATKGILGKLGLTAGGGSLMPTPLGGILATSALSGLMTPKEEDEDEEDLTTYRGEPLDIADIRSRPRDFLATRFLAEGGSTEKEPVAKKTMPLLDMGGKEMDLRAEGGFVPIGRMEKADDVPARLSKNEFVFTADAVRNAGDGSVDKGAEVMYNMMKNLEAGGEVSEESQGLEGARKMFQTSQRLEEVL